MDTRNPLKLSGILTRESDWSEQKWDNGRAERALQALGPGIYKIYKLAAPDFGVWQPGQWGTETTKIMPNLLQNTKLSERCPVLLCLALMYDVFSILNIPWDLTIQESFHS